MNLAGLDTNTTIQFCMMQPSDLLNSLQFNAVTNGRASDDYAGGKVFVVFKIRSVFR
jgi:hypothetical protein